MFLSALRRIKGRGRNSDVIFVVPMAARGGWLLASFEATYRVSRLTWSSSRISSPGLNRVTSLPTTSTCPVLVPSPEVVLLALVDAAHARRCQDVTGGERASPENAITPGRTGGPSPFPAGRQASGARRP
jgi:hypothetical protein